MPSAKASPANTFSNSLSGTPFLYARHCPRRRELGVLENDMASSNPCPDEEHANVLCGCCYADGVMCSADETVHLNSI